MKDETKTYLSIKIDTETRDNLAKLTKIVSEEVGMKVTRVEVLKKIIADTLNAKKES